MKYMAISKLPVPVQSSEISHSINEEQRQRKYVEEEAEDGYHTPTSPKHRITPLKRCPLAPRKPLLKQNFRRKWKKAVCSSDPKFLRVIRRIGTSRKIEYMIDLCIAAADN